MAQDRSATVFIGSSAEGIEYARAIESNFFHEPEIELFPWYREFREPMLTTMQQLQRLQTFDFAIFVLTPDDKVASRGDEEPAPRDNLIYELGITVAALGERRVFPLKPHCTPMRLPSDILGVNPHQFYLVEQNADARAHEGAVAVACHQIRDQIRQLGPLPSRTGETSTGVRSGIRFHPKIAVNSTRESLRFKIAYRGPGTLIGVGLNAFFIEVRPDRGGDQYARRWHKIETFSVDLPEIMIDWTMRHEFSRQSEFGQFLSFTGESDGPTLDSLNALPGKLAVFVRGTDSTTLAPQFAKKEYEPSAIEQGRFRRHVDIDQNGNVTGEHWDRFEKFDGYEAT